MAGETPQSIKKVYMWPAFIIQLNIYVFTVYPSDTVCVTQSIEALLDYCMIIDSIIIYGMATCLRLTPQCR